MLTEKCIKVCVEILLNAYQETASDKSFKSLKLKAEGMGVENFEVCVPITAARGGRRVFFFLVLSLCVLL